ncbi:hypothetical protein YC2023_099415 [Brassica napus]
MGQSSSFTTVMVAVLLVMMFGSAYSGNFFNEFDLTWGDHRGKIFNGGNMLSLSLDRVSGSGFKSKKEYLFGRIDMQLKLVAGNSAGTVTTYYLSSQGATHDEIDFEFLGNETGKPYVLHTNVFAQGKGNREQQFYLWFDPTKNFHTYSIVWRPQHIIFLVENLPIRVFNNAEKLGVPFPKNQPMMIYSSLWNADDWATRGGLVKTDWSKAPFTAYYRGFNAAACTVSSGCDPKFKTSLSDSELQTANELNAYGRRRLRWVQKYFMIYNYCSDLKRFPRGFPPECRRSRTQLPGAAAIFYIKLVRLIDAGSHSRVSTCGSCSSLDDPLKLTLSTTLSSSLSQVSTLSSSLSRRPSQAHSPDDPLKLTLSSLENPLQLAQTTVVPLQLALTAAVLEVYCFVGTDELFKIID